MKIINIMESLKNTTRQKQIKYMKKLYNGKILITTHDDIKFVSSIYFEDQFIALPNQDIKKSEIKKQKGKKYIEDVEKIHGIWRKDGEFLIKR